LHSRVANLSVTAPHRPSGVPVFAVVSFSLDNIKAEIRGYRNPFSFSKKEWFGQEYTPDLCVLVGSMGTRLYFAILSRISKEIELRCFTESFHESEIGRWTKRVKEPPPTMKLRGE